MKVPRFTVIALVTFALPAAAQERIETVFRDARVYTVRIRTQVTTPFMEEEQGSWFGAGFLVDAGRRWVVTNAHVAGKSPSTVEVAFAGGVYRPARKIYVDSFIDMAVLELADDGRRHSVATMDCGDPPQVGEGVGAFGHPLGMPFTGTRGIVSGRTDQFVEDYIQIDATIDGGNSGGPVISLRDGRIVGIATAGADERTKRLNLATPMQDVCRILELLRQGIAPDPPLMQFSLLVDEDNRHTLEVGATHDDSRWPFKPGDRIVAVGRGNKRVTTYGSLISALRGESGTVPVRIQRGGHEIVLQSRPERRPSVIARRGVSIDGALIAPYAFEDSLFTRAPVGLFVHSVESGSAAETQGLTKMDIVHSVDGLRFDELEPLIAYLAKRSGDDPLRLVLRRFSDAPDRWSEYQVRELPGEDVRDVGPDARLLTSGP